MKLDDREDLQQLRVDAIRFADSVADNLWKTAYIELARAADRVDAMEARTEDKE